ncbi:oligosaccharide flippase family protein [Candidatus Parcubacteria bacterium]|nr:oligosaccharide flippase family protein [Patescibacteria group bacterium]MBU4308963.1 oligosaccharide flippase family protein [Patescibacteria group bacterium]MBU4431867.1 oligosaccharide flippase family protein [Patescibacteria group bacterium]MBU4577323.1 oligosaccharide flippase family protein [Patescibacteria group bacterium]MCG2697011.1 oligosaccharide flippase family protein [Candidatus Parcubacteria bacterium]
MIKRVLRDEFVKNNIVLFVGSVMVAFLNYLYHPVLGRMMNVADFGEVQVIISLFMLTGVLGGVIKNVIVNITANKEEGDNQEEVVLMLGKLSLYAVLLFSFLMIVFSGHLRRELNFHSDWPFIALAVIVSWSMAFNVRLAVLQGLNKFLEISVSGAIVSLGRLIFAVIFVYIGWSSFGAIFGLLLAQVLAFYYVFLKTRQQLKLNAGKHIQIDGRIKKELWYGLSILISSFAVTFLYTFDVVLVKYFFSANEAGLYSGIATVGRIIFFLTASISMVLLSAVKIDKSKKDNLKTLSKGLLLTIGLGGATLLTFYLFYDMVVGLLIGSKYLLFSKYLFKLGILSFLASIVNLIFVYFFALRNKQIIFPSLLAPLFVLILTLFNHDTIMSVINNFIFGGVFVLTALLSLLYVEIRKEEK